MMEKINMQRIVPVHDALEEHLSGFNGWNRTTSNAYGKYFGALKRKLGFTDKKKAFHSIRGNTSTNFENLKIPEHLANKIVGHKSQRRYHDLWLLLSGTGTN
jgi:hypothetical protein